MNKDFLQEALEGIGDLVGSIAESVVNLPDAALGDVEKHSSPDCSSKTDSLERK